MALNNIKDNSDGGDFELQPAGVHKARCAVICDLGLKDSQWGAQQKIYWNFELVETRMESADRPYSVGEQMSTKFGRNSGGEPSRLRGRLEGWRGKNYTDEEARLGPNLHDVIGRECLINIMHETDKDGKTWARIAAIMPGQPDTPQLSSQPLFFSWDYEGQENDLPDWLKKKLGRFPGAPEAPADPLPDGDFDDDIPF